MLFILSITFCQYINVCVGVGVTSYNTFDNTLTLDWGDLYGRFLNFTDAIHIMGVSLNAFDYPLPLSLWGIEFKCLPHLNICYTHVRYCAFWFVRFFCCSSINTSNICIVCVFTRLVQLYLDLRLVSKNLYWIIEFSLYSCSA